jgi:hypothetical protein
MSDNTLYQSDAQAVTRDPRAAPRQSAPREAAPPTNGGERLRRRRSTVDPFYVDPRIIPPGFSYEWKRRDVFGQPDETHWIEMRENHWKPVPASRHPELAGQNASIIERKGTVLCERPTYLSDEAQMEDLQKALAPVQHMEEIMYGTKPGELTRDHPSVRKLPGVRQQWAPGEPIEEGHAGLSAEP